MGTVADLYGDREDAKLMLSINNVLEAGADNDDTYDLQLDRHNFMASRFIDSKLAGLGLTLPFAVVPDQIRTAATKMMAGQFEEGKSDHYSDDAPITRHHPWWKEGCVMVEAYAQDIQSGGAGGNSFATQFARAKAPDERAPLFQRTR